jgi:hypothetical protein
LKNTEILFKRIKVHNTKFPNLRKNEQKNK